jgi:hypothetical protein
MLWVRYNYPVPKRQCTRRAEWRFQRGKPAELLSAHYHLDCDHGTPVMTCWAEGGSEPIYVCESHAHELGRSRERYSDVRFITAQSDDTDDPIKSEDRTEAQQIPDTKSSDSPTCTQLNLN